MTRFSIIIPTHNRPDYLKRSLRYYSSFEADCTIVIADSSDDYIKKSNKKSVSSFPDINYIYLDHYAQNINLSHKIADAAETVIDEYCVLCADDDFLTSAGITYAVEYLTENPDYAIAHGQYIYFSTGGQNQKKSNFVWGSTYDPHSIDYEDPVTRLTEHLSHYSAPTMYAVHKTVILRTAFKETLKYTEDDRFGELLPSMLSLVYGKMKSFDVLYCARERISDSASDTSKNMLDFIKEGSYEKKYDRFRRCLIEHLAEVSSLNFGRAKLEIDGAISKYLSRFYTDENRKKKPIKQKLSHIYRYLKNPMNVPFSKNFSEFESIRRYVLQHPIG
ncbi:MAG: TIGR00180 family glycosyltransferase [Spirochaetes bacterium]|nr:TIGR00180 family glycosyltransferase [Spirochaetota bacterium]